MVKYIAKITLKYIFSKESKWEVINEIISTFKLLDDIFSEIRDRITGSGIISYLFSV